MYTKTVDYIHSLVSKLQISGINYAIITPEMSVKESIGFAQIIPEKIVLRDDMLFDVASLTKVIGTTSVVLKMREENSIDFDQKLNFYLPEFQDKKITLRHLLTHTSDIVTYIPNRDQLTKDELIAAYLTVKSGKNIGQQVKYTDTNFILLGLLIEKTYSKPVQKVIEEEVLQPLNMINSTFSPKDCTKCVATEITNSRGIIRGVVHDTKAFVLSEECGSAGLFLTMEDAMKYTTMLIRNGVSSSNKQFFKPETISMLLQNQTKCIKGFRSFGWDLIADLKTGNPILYHTGYTGTFMLIDCFSKESFVFLSNRIHPADNREEYIIMRDELIHLYLVEKAHKHLL